MRRVCLVSPGLAGLLSLGLTGLAAGPATGMASNAEEDASAGASPGDPGDTKGGEKRTPKTAGPPRPGPGPRRDVGGGGPHGAGTQTPASARSAPRRPSVVAVTTTVRCRPPHAGVIASVVEAGPGQHFELVEGGTPRPDSLVFQVENQEPWKDHLSNLGVVAEADGSKLTVHDPDGLRIVLE